MKSAVLLAVLVLASFVLAGCHPMENKELDNKDRDSTSKAMKQAGSDE